MEWKANLVFWKSQPAPQIILNKVLIKTKADKYALIQGRGSNIVIYNALKSVTSCRGRTRVPLRFRWRNLYERVFRKKYCDKKHPWTEKKLL